MKKFVRLTALTLSLLMATTSLAGCQSTTATTSGNSTAATTTGTKIDTSKHVTLTGYLLGDKPAGMDDVLAELNKKTEKDLNCDVKIDYLGWGEYVTKYPLLMASGQGVDFIYSSSWALYGSEAKKGAFATLTEDDLKTYMPLHYKATPAAGWQQAKYDGKIMLIPTSSPDVKTPTITIRQDLAEKYNVDTSNVKSIADLEPYFAAIKQNEKAMTPMVLDKQKDIGQPFYAYLNATAKEGWVAMQTATSQQYDIEAEKPTAVSMNDPAVLTEFTAVATKMKEWYTKGYINKDAMNNTTTSNDAFKSGKSAVAFSNTIDTSNIDAAAQGNGWKIKIIANVDSNGFAQRDAYIGNGVAIAASSPNKERTMMFLDKLMEQKDYNMLAYYGVEGKNYAINSDGKITLPTGVTAANNTYPADAAGIWFTNKNQFPEVATWSTTYATARKDANSHLKDVPLIAITVDESNIKTQDANLSSVLSQYFVPLELGQVSDVASAIATFSKQCDNAGIADVNKEINTQITTFLATLK